MLLFFEAALTGFRSDSDAPAEDFTSLEFCCKNMHTGQISGYQLLAASERLPKSAGTAGQLTTSGDAVGI